MRVMITGGRTYGSKIEGAYLIADREARAFLSLTLDDLHQRTPISTMIVGDASGADLLAYRWANERDVPVERYRADWRKLRRGAGPERNGRMIRQGKPDLVVAFPGGDGTEDAMRQAHRAGIEVREMAP